MAKNTVQSVEPNIADLVNGWLKSYKVDYKLEQESLNTEIDQALNDYFSKNGGKGGNRPDAKLLLQANDGKYYPILIEYKGYKDKLVKLDAEGNVANRNAKNQPDYTNINSYAVNGAVHYSNAVLHYTSYTDVIAIGVTGYKDASGKLKHLIGVYYVAKSNFGVGQKVDEYTRSARKKSTNNLRDTDNAKERYQELVNLVRFGKSKMSIFTEQDYYEGVIDPENGADWNQTSPIDTKPTVEDFKKTVSDYLAWEVSTLLKNQPSENERLGK